MRLGSIVLQLRAADTRFDNRIAGAAEFAYASENTLNEEMAFVVPLTETATRNMQHSGLVQTVSETFAVIVALRNDYTVTDKMGLTAYDILDDVRQEIWTGILGWLISGMESLISYRGGRLLRINRAWLWYQFEFTMDKTITEDDGVPLGATNNLDTIWAQYVLMPEHEDRLVTSGLTISDPDMEQMVDLTEDPDAGAFGKGFYPGFDVYTGD